MIAIDSNLLSKTGSDLRTMLNLNEFVIEGGKYYVFLCKLLRIEKKEGHLLWYNQPASIECQKE